MRALEPEPELELELEDDAGAGVEAAALAGAGAGDGGDCGTAALPMGFTNASRCETPGAGSAAGARRAGSEAAMAAARSGARSCDPLSADRRVVACCARSVGSSVSNDARARIASAPRTTTPNAAGSIHHRLLRVGLGGVGGLGPMRASSLPPSR